MSLNFSSSEPVKDNAHQSLEQSYSKVNRYFTIIVFITAIIGASSDSIAYLLHQFTFLFSINIVLTVLLLTDLLLLLTKKLALPTAFLFLVYITLTNITITHIHEFQYDNFYSKVILIGFWGLLFVVLSALVLGSWHPYMVMLWADALLIYDIIRTEGEYLTEVIPIIIVTLAGLSYGISMYVKLLRKAFQKNQDILIDIAKQKSIVEELARELEEKNANLNKLQLLQKDLTGLIVHDMKNPLNSILNNSSQNPTEIGYKYIHESGRQMLVLVENILDVNMMEYASMDYRLEALNLSEVIGEASIQVAFLIQQHAISVETEVDNSIYVLADREILKRIFVNLFTNAIRHSPENSNIKLHCAQQSSKELIISIKDQGEGIPEKYRNKVFEKFVQVISRKSGSKRSTGLGLAFCQMSIQAMKGKIWIANTSKNGTTISFSLPAAKAGSAIVPASTEPKIRITFTDKDIQYLLPQVDKLKELDVYKGGQIFKEIAEVNPINRNIEKWIEEVKTAVYSVNNEYYREMLDLVEHKPK